MKKILAFLLVLTACQSERTINERTINYEGEEILVGEITVEGLQDEPFSEWYSYYYEDREPDTAQLDQIADVLNDTEITLFLGTWCSDSQEQVPGFIRMLKYVGYDFEKLTIIALERKEDRSMVSPTGVERNMDITHVPTFIFHQEDLEIGRIVEFPKETLEKDISMFFGVD